MGIYIKIEKIFEEDSTAYYKIITQAFGGAEFYMGIDKVNRIVKLYLTNDFTKPTRIINCDDINERVGKLPGVDPSIIGRVLMRASKTLDLEKFPEFLDYTS